MKTPSLRMKANAGGRSSFVWGGSRPVYWCVAGMAAVALAAAAMPALGSGHATLEIDLHGASTVTVDSFSDFNDPGATCKYYIWIVVNGEDTQSYGNPWDAVESYTQVDNDSRLYEYTCDHYKAGSPIYAYRNVHLRDYPPVLTLQHTSATVYDYPSETLLGPQCSDQREGQITFDSGGLTYTRTITPGGGLFGPEVHTFTYTCTDGTGNTATATGTVRYLGV